MKVNPRQRVKIRIRKKIRGTEARPRLTVFKSDKHTYAQLVCDDSGSTLVSASTLDKDVMSALSGKSKKSVDAAKVVGSMLAKKAKDKKLNSAVFDRNGFLYCGRVQAVADGAREGGLDF